MISFNYFVNCWNDKGGGSFNNNVLNKLWDLFKIFVRWILKGGVERGWRVGLVKIFFILIKLYEGYVGYIYM